METGWNEKEGRREQVARGRASLAPARQMPRREQLAQCLHRQWRDVIDLRAKDPRRMIYRIVFVGHNTGKTQYGVRIIFSKEKSNVSGGNYT